jgi:hypothetical protein
MLKAFSSEQVYATQQETYSSYSFVQGTTGVSIYNDTAVGSLYAVNNSTGLARSCSGSNGSEVLMTNALDYSFMVVTSSSVGGWDTWLHAIYGRHYSSSVSFSFPTAPTGTILDQRAIASYRGLSRHFGNSADEQQAIWIGDRLLTSTVFLSLGPQVRGDRLRRGFTSLILSTASAQLLPFADGSAAAYDASTYITASDVPFFNNTERVLGSSLGLLSSSTKGYIGKINYDTGLIALDLVKLVGDATIPDWFLSGAMGYSLNECLTFGPRFVEWGLLQRLKEIGWNAVTDNSVVTYYCNASPADMNYSSNPTFTEQQYLTSTTGRWADSQAFGTNGRVVTLSGSNYVRTYITGIGLFDSANQLVATAKCNRPIEKRAGDWLTFAVPVTW